MQVGSATTSVSNEQLDLSTRENRQAYVHTKLTEKAHAIYNNLRECSKEIKSMEGVAFSAKHINDQFAVYLSLDARIKKLSNKVMEYAVADLRNDAKLASRFANINAKTNDPLSGMKLINGIAAPLIKDLAEEFDRVSAAHNIEPSFVDQLIG